jgi:predicted nucleic acid-binding protein
VKIGSVQDNANPHGTAADLTPDAHLAALSIEHGARLYSTDNDFSRF